MSFISPEFHKYVFLCRGCVHQSQTDFQFMVPSAFGKYMGLRHNLEPAIAIDLCVKATRGFMAKHLSEYNNIRQYLQLATIFPEKEHYSIVL